MEIILLGFTIKLTIWKLVGYTGVSIFAARWVVQMIASHKAKRSKTPSLFWYMSFVGSLLSLSYFTFGKNDSVGIMGNLFPCVVSAYNLILDWKHRKSERLAEAVDGVAEVELS
jgi:lipid-A-disaccharide synthase-like uncharacterized protein